MTSRTWAITLHLPNDPEELAAGPQGFPPCYDQIINAFGTSHLKLLYLTGQIETTTTGGYHAQLAATVSNPIRMTAMKKILPTAHMEIPRSWKHLVDYCHKEETRLAGPWTYGQEPRQGKRSDLEEAARMIQSGSMMPEVAKNHPVVTVRYFKGLQYLISLQDTAIYKPKKVGLFWGGTGTGKTLTVHQELDDLYNAADINKPWFDGYHGQKHVLFDECGKGMMPFNDLKRLTDGYKMLAPIKGQMIDWSPTTIILTSNIPMDQWYPFIEQEDLKALKRRIREFHFPEEKQLAIAWLRGTLIEEPPPKRQQQPTILTPQDSPDDVFAMYGY